MQSSEPLTLKYSYFTYSWFLPDMRKRILGWLLTPYKWVIFQKSQNMKKWWEPGWLYKDPLWLLVITCCVTAIVSTCYINVCVTDSSKAEWFRATNVCVTLSMAQGDPRQPSSLVLLAEHLGLQLNSNCRQTIDDLLVLFNTWDIFKIENNMW